MSFPSVYWSDHCWDVIGDKPDVSRKEQSRKREAIRMIFKQFRGPLGEEGLLRFMGFHTKQKFSGSRGLLGKGML